MAFEEIVMFEIKVGVYKKFATHSLFMQKIILSDNTKQQFLCEVNVIVAMIALLAGTRLICTVWAILTSLLANIA